MTRVIGGGVATGCALVLAGCGRQSTLSPRSPQTHDIRTLWWWMLAAATVVFFGAMTLLGLAWIRRRKPGLRSSESGNRCRS